MAWSGCGTRFRWNRTSGSGSRRSFTDAERFRRKVPYPETEAFRLHTKERTVQDWFRFIQRGAELTDFVLRVGAHVRDGAPTSTGWRRT